MTTTEGINLLPTKADIRLSDVPATYLGHVLEHISRTTPTIFRDVPERRMTFYISVLCDLAGTCNDRDAERIFDERQQTLPTGKPITSATPDDLRRATLALHGLARDRTERGPAARPLATWLEAADTALSAYRGWALQPA